MAPLTGGCLGDRARARGGDVDRPRPHQPGIAETLVLSPHTVGDHVKSLFEKLDVSSRQELVARVFLDEYLPEVIQGTPLTSHGRFEVE